MINADDFTIGFDIYEHAHLDCPDCEAMIDFPEGQDVHPTLGQARDLANRHIEERHSHPDLDSM